MKVEPQKEHQWLQKLVGEWTYESDVTMNAGEPSAKAVGTEIVRSLDGIWTVGEATGEMPGGGKATSITTLGFDPAKRRFVGTWIGSMMHQLWVYDGELDSTERVLTLNSEGPGMEDPKKTSKYRDIVEIIDDNHRVLRGNVLGEDGQWSCFMTMNFYRKREER